MADNVAITAGVGTPIATDDVAGAHYQKVKLYDSTADSSTGIGLGNGTAATALRVTLPTDGTGVVGLNAGSNNIGDVDVLSVIPGTGGAGYPVDWQGKRKKLTLKQQPNKHLKKLLDDEGKKVLARRAKKKQSKVQPIKLWP